MRKKVLIVLLFILSLVTTLPIKAYALEQNNLNTPSLNSYYTSNDYVIDAYNIEFISDSLKPFVEEFKRRGLSLNYSVGLDVASLKTISTKNFDSVFKGKSIFKNLIITGIESFNDIHANPFRKHEDTLIDCFVNFLNLEEIKTLPIFVECPKKEPLKLFALISSTLKKDVITKDDIYNDLKIID